MKNNKKPENNPRDLLIAFTLVAFSYIIVGVFGFAAYWQKDIPQDFLQNFSGSNIGAIIGRFALLLQLITVYPVLAMFIRYAKFALFKAKLQAHLFQFYRQKPILYFTLEE